MILFQRAAGLRSHMEMRSRVRLGLFAMSCVLAVVEFAFALAFLVSSPGARSVLGLVELILDFRVGQSSVYCILYCYLSGPCRAAPLPSAVFASN